MKPEYNWRRVAVWVAGILAVLILVLIPIWFVISHKANGQDQVGFAIGGGPIDSNKNKVVSDLIGPGRHHVGVLNGMWRFPSYKTVRFHDFKVPVTTRDGKNVTIAGQMAFRFVGEEDPDVAREFAEGLGARTYGGERPGQSGAGWENMLDQLITPEINSTMKDQFGRRYCAEFEPACVPIDPRENVPPSNPEDVYDSVGETLQDRVDAKLGNTYLRDIRVRVAAIELPGEVKANIDRVTTEQAKTKAAEQSIQTADAEAQAIAKRGKAIRENPEQVAIEVAKVCNGLERCTVIVDASKGNVQATVPAR